MNHCTPTLANHGRFLLATFLALSTSAHDLGAVCNLPLAAQDLLQQYQGLHVYTDPRSNPPTTETCIWTFWGKSMTEGDTPEAAAQAWMTADWMDANSNAFGVDDLDLRLASSNGLGPGTFTIFRYRQYQNGAPVTPAGKGVARLLVLNGPPSRVVHVGARLKHSPVGGFRADIVDGQTALTSVRTMLEYADLTEWSIPELVVYAGDEEEPPVRAWMFWGTDRQVCDPQAYTFYVNAADGALVHVQSEVEYADIAGHVGARATPGTLPDVDYNPPEVIDFAGAHVYLGTNGVITDYCDSNGLYTLTDAGTNAVLLRGDLVGEWVAVTSAQGSPLILEQTVVPPAWTDFVFNSNGTELNSNGNDGHTAQINAFVHVTRAHDWYKERQSAFNALDVRLEARVNCDGLYRANAAFVKTPEPHFEFGDGGPYAVPPPVNWAYSSIIAHEYAHFLQLELQLVFTPVDQSFKEGMADAFALLLYDDPVFGRDVYGLEQSIRDTAAANKQFPCATYDDPYVCGLLLSGVWWDVKVALQQTYGPETGLTIAQQLFTDWSQIVRGADSVRNSAHGLTVIEVLEVDDNDGNVCSNGTPHYCQICLGFAAHGIQCPDCLLDRDCDSNGVPDECEPDCNSNGTADACDIAAGVSADCDTNGVPDECETDCNTNGLADECDLGAGTSQDCDANGIPDECDLLVFDCNTNGTLDPCECFPNDYDRDGDADLQDFAGFQTCINTNGDTPSFDCECAFDLSSDDRVDLDDFALWQPMFNTNGPQMPCWAAGMQGQYAQGSGDGGSMMGSPEGGDGSMMGPPEDDADLWTCTEAALTFELRPLGGGDAVTELTPYTTYELHYQAGSAGASPSPGSADWPRVNSYVLLAVAASADQGLADALPPAEGDWSATGNFVFFDIEEALGEPTAAPDGPEGYSRYQAVMDDFWPDSDAYAAPEGCLCQITSGTAGELHLDLYLDWIDTQEYERTAMQVQTRFVVRASAGE